MKKSYKFKVIPAAGDTQIVDIASATGVGSTITPALAGAQYQLIDTDTGLAPDNIRATRKGSDLHISFDGRETADLVIADFYTVSGNATPGLMGELQSGIFHPYIPESGEWARSVSQMSDGMSSIGMALGGDPLSLAEFAPAALMPMAAAGGVNPLMAAPLALLGLAGGGGGGGSAQRSGTPPTVNGVGILPSDDTGQSNSDGITSNNKPHITGITEAGAAVSITINNRTYTDTADPQGKFSIQVTDALPDGVQNYTVKVGNDPNSTELTRAITIDTSTISTSQNVGITIDAITQDTGFNSSDFLTRDNTLTWSGKLDTANAAFNSADWLLVQLLNSSTQVLATEYIKPTQISGVWNWTWSGQAQALADGVYTLKTQLVDTAGNPLSATPWTRNVTIDTQAGNSNGQADPNAAFMPHITRLLNDTGTSPSDYLTSARQLTFTGHVARSTGTGSFDASAGRVLTEIMDSNGKIVSFQHLTPTSNGDWTTGSSPNLGLQAAVSTYIFKSMAVDNAGNVMNAATQAFTVDLAAATVSNPSIVSTAGVNDFTQMSFTASKHGIFNFNGVDQTQNNLDLGGATTLTFAPETFKIKFTDDAGNVWLKTNTQTWDFHLTQPIALATISSNNSGAFDQGQLVGSIGKYVMTADQTLALSTLAPLAPTHAATGAINHIDMHGNGAQNLTVSMADVLQLGVSNSFSNAAEFKDHLQMRVDGDAADKLTLSKLGGSSIDTWLTHGQLTLDGQSYTAYYNAPKALEVFVQSSIPVTVI